MSDEILNLSEIGSESRRGRKSKYGQKLWEASTAKEKAKYALILSQNWERRKLQNKVGTGCQVWNKTNGRVEYIDDENPYRKLVSDRHHYEIEMETVFHTHVDDVENQNDDGVFIFESNDESNIVDVPSRLNSILNVRIMDGFYVMSEFKFDDSTQEYFAKVPAGVVSKKMSLQDIFDKYEDFCKTKAFSLMKDTRRKRIIIKWIGYVSRFLKEEVIADATDIEILEID